MVIKSFKNLSLFDQNGSSLGKIVVWSQCTFFCIKVYNFEIFFCPQGHVTMHIFLMPLWNEGKQPFNEKWWFWWFFINYFDEKCSYLCLNKLANKFVFFTKMLTHFWISSIRCPIYANIRHDPRSEYNQQKSECNEHQWSWGVWGFSETPKKILRL